MRRHAGRIAGAVAAVVIAAVLGACAPASDLAVPDGLRVELVQQRSDVTLRQAQVRVVNGSDQAITVGAVAVDDPRFAADATRVIADRSTIVAAGGSVDVRVQLAQAACDVPDAADPEVILDVTVGDRAGTIAVAAADPLGFLAPLHARECLAADVAEAVGLSFTAFEPSPAGEAGTLRLRAEPAGGAATVVAVQPTVLVDFVPAGSGAFPLDLRIIPESAPVVIDLPIVPARCDPHVVQEDKRGTIFTIDVEVATEPGTIELFVGEDMRGRILSWVAEWCGFGGGQSG